MKLGAILYKLLKEEEEQIATKSDMDKILERSPKVTKVLVKLLTTQKSLSDKAIKELRNVVTDIKLIAPKPTTFRIVFKNGNYFDLKYDPTPLMLNHPDQFKPEDAFVVLIAGKRYEISSKSEYQQALDYINLKQRTQPVNQAPAASPEGGEEEDGELPQEEPGEDNKEEKPEDQKK